MAITKEGICVGEPFDESPEIGIANSIRHILEYVGDSPDRAGLKDTPLRMIQAWSEIFSGYELVKGIPKMMRVFKDGAQNYDEMVVVRNIEFTSFCEHHFLPFLGVAHVGYLPNPKVGVVGLSKIPRLVDIISKMLQVQERMTTTIVRAINDTLKPRGAGCVIVAKHLCMGCRGIKKPDAETITSKMTGFFLSKPEVRAEFFSLAHR